MSDFTIFKKIEKVARAYEAAKRISIAFGANPESFLETDRAMAEIYEAAKKKIAGGIILEKDLPVSE